MLGLVGKAWSKLRASWNMANNGECAVGEAAGEISERIRRRYDTARRQTRREPTRRWLREQGVMEDWRDAW